MCKRKHDRKSLCAVMALAILVGLVGFPGENAVMAKISSDSEMENTVSENKILMGGKDEKELLLKNSLIYVEEKNNNLTETKSGVESKQTIEKKTESSKSVSGNGINMQKEISSSEDESVPIRLQVPQKLEIILDPWEMDGKEQIYSGEYLIKNISGAKGRLKLTGIADGFEGNVNIQPDSNNIHIGNGRNIFIELVINNENKLVLLPGGTDYEAVLEENAGIKFTFTGVMNEYAEGNWHDRDVKVMLIYDWVADTAEGEVMPDADGMEKESLKEKRTVSNVEDEIISSVDMMEDCTQDEQNPNINITEESKSSTDSIGELGIEAEDRN